MNKRKKSNFRDKLIGFSAAVVLFLATLGYICAIIYGILYIWAFSTP